MNHQWVVCQIGAREHYNIARALSQSDSLRLLVTDYWFRSRFDLGAWSKSMRDRFDPEINPMRVRGLNTSFVISEFFRRFDNIPNGWQAMIDRNDWFQRQCIRTLEKLPDQNLTVFSYSYAAREIFEYSKSRGWRTILGQIDPGQVEADLVQKLATEAAISTEEFPPASYWDSWKDELRLADKVVVNSNWSRRCLMETGIPDNKVVSIPLAIDQDRISDPHTNSANLPTAANPEKLHVLYLGQVILRKGVLPLFESIAAAGDKVVWHIVGEEKISVPESIRAMVNVNFYGPVRRSLVHKFYEMSDVFILPTHSDGFAITQLESLSRGVPVIASKNCGDVVEHGKNGLLLDCVSAEAITKAVLSLASDRRFLTRLQSNAALSEKYSFDALNRNLMAL